MTNLIPNADFSEMKDGQNWYKYQGINELKLPIGWLCNWHNQASAADDVGGEEMPLPTQDQPFHRPEFTTWAAEDAPENERVLLFAELPYVVKGFAGSSPVWFWFFRSVSGLRIGREYTFSVEVYPDLVSSYDGGKQWAADPNSGEFRLWAGSGAPVDWMNGSAIPFGQWNLLTVKFTASHLPQHVGVEFRGRHGLANNGIFIRRPVLLEVGDFSPAIPADVALGGDVWSMIDAIGQNVENEGRLVRWLARVGRAQG